MEFNAALQLLKDGKYVTREGWEQGKYLVIMPGMPYIWQVGTVPQPAAGNYIPLLVDIYAVDWLEGTHKPVVVNPEITPVDDKAVA